MDNLDTIELCVNNRMLKVGSYLAKGTHGRIYEVLDTQGQVVPDMALKVCNCSSRRWLEVCSIHRELMRSPHTHVLKVYGTKFIPEERKACIVMQRLWGPDLVELVVKHYQQYSRPGCIKSAFVRRCIHEMLLGLSFMHDTLHMAHCDVKLDNMKFGTANFMTSKLTLLDVDSCFRMISDEPILLSTQYPVGGTVWYLSPEALKGYIHPTCDVWALGVCLYTMLQGGFPFNIKSYVDKKDWHGAYKFIESCFKKGDLHFSPAVLRRFPEAVDLCTSMLCFSAPQRITCAEALTHPWFHNMESEKSHRSVSTTDSFSDLDIHETDHTEITPKYVEPAPPAALHSTHYVDTDRCVSRPANGCNSLEELMHNHAIDKKTGQRMKDKNLKSGAWESGEISPKLKQRKHSACGSKDVNQAVGSELVERRKKGMEWECWESPSRKDDKVSEKSPVGKLWDKEVVELRKEFAPMSARETRRVAWAKDTTGQHTCRAARKEGVGYPPGSSVEGCEARESFFDQSSHKTKNVEGSQCEDQAEDQGDYHEGSKDGKNKCEGPDKVKSKGSHGGILKRNKSWRGKEDREDGKGVISRMFSRLKSMGGKGENPL